MQTAGAIQSRRVRNERMMMNSDVSGGPLNGIRVVELGQLIAGPFCGQLLGDMGAAVVKLEQLGVGDPLRPWGTGSPPTWCGVIGRNKYSVADDPRSEQNRT